MSLKNEIMFPFGNPYKDKLESHCTFTAMCNVLKLAKDKMRMIKGEPEQLIFFPDSSEAINAQRSIEELESVIKYISEHKE